MRIREILFGILIGLVSMAPVLGQRPEQTADPKRTPGVSGTADPNRASFLAAAGCKSSPPEQAPVTLPSDVPFVNVATKEIPGVVAAGLHWKTLWEQPGNADGIVGFDDGSVWIPVVEHSNVVRIDNRGKASVIYNDTYAGGALAANANGQVFIAERALNTAVWILKPGRKLLANTIKGEPFECSGRFINDIAADNQGGVYMAMDRIYYINPEGVVIGPLSSVAGNGLILSPDEKTFYTTGRLASAGGPADGGNAVTQGLVAYDVEPDGSLTHERQFADICSDGLAVDAEGRIYCAEAEISDPANPAKGIVGIGVVSPEGKTLGVIPQPRRLVTLAFGGPDKKTLFAEGSRPIQVVSLPMIAQGNKTRPK
ncbi:MAG: SMP-30/gluconolactonase/LRE family protein [Gammaproteobacteria bacterium]